MDQASGKIIWEFYSEGPIRLAPTFHEGKIYVGSDDGRAYCLNASTGVEQWRYVVNGGNRRIPGNGRLISTWPLRSGVVISEGNALFAAGVFPKQGCYWIAVNAKTGKELAKKKLDISPQGYVFGDKGQMKIANGRNKPRVVDKYIEDKVRRAEFKKHKGYPYSLIKAGNTIFGGGDGQVAAFSTEDGKKLWEAKVEGSALCLAVSNGQLLVSTDKGLIYSFGKGTKGNAINVKKDSYKSLEINKTQAEEVLKISNISQGYALLVGAEKTELAIELAKLTSMRIVLSVNSDKALSHSRATIVSSGLFGKRIVVHKCSVNKLPYVDYVFNLIISSSESDWKKSPELIRVLRPCGGTHMVKREGKWQVKRRGKLTGAGEWSHQFGDSANTSCSHDSSLSSTIRMQWFGRPGPKKMLNRHTRVHSPLYANGRMYVLGNQYFYGLDAYNGTILWEKPVPDMEVRVNVSRDGGFMVADDDYFYVAVKNTCRVYEGQTGEVSATLKVPQKNYNWGYLGKHKNMLVGSAVKEGCFYSNNDNWYDASNGRQNAKLLGHHLFAFETKTSLPKWKYEGLIIGPSITLADGKVFFVENRSASLLKEKPGKSANEDLWKNTYLVSLDVRTGKKLWEKKFKFVRGKAVFYVSYSDGVVLVVSSPHTGYTLYGFDAKDGTKIWENSCGYRKKHGDTHHGGHMQHPVIIKGVIYQEPYNFDLKTGKQGELTIDRGGGGCGLLSSCDGFIYGRGNFPRIIFKDKPKTNVPITLVSRPGCAINIIPAGGLIMIPDGSSGCSCEFAIQGSMAFAPLK